MQVRIQNESPDVGSVEVTKNGEVIHTLAAGQQVSVNVSEGDDFSFAAISDEKEETDPKVSGILSKDLEGTDLQAGQEVIVDRHDKDGSPTVVRAPGDEERKAAALAGNPVPEGNPAK